MQVPGLGLEAQGSMPDQCVLGVDGKNTYKYGIEATISIQDAILPGGLLHLAIRLLGVLHFGA